MRWVDWPTEPGVWVGFLSQMEKRGAEGVDIPGMLAAVGGGLGAQALAGRAFDKTKVSPWVRGALIGTTMGVGSSLASQALDLGRGRQRKPSLENLLARMAISGGVGAALGTINK